MTTVDAHERNDAREHVWQRLAANPIRRAMLGRMRCDALVRTALNAMPDDVEMAVAGEGTDFEEVLRTRTERRVLDLYSERCGFAFLTFVILWAVSAIVQILVVRWWTKHHQEQQS